MLLTSNKEQKILHSYSSESIHINLLEEETEIQELRLQLDRTHEGDCKGVTLRYILYSDFRPRSKC